MFRTVLAKTMFAASRYAAIRDWFWCRIESRVASMTVRPAVDATATEVQVSLE